MFQALFACWFVFVVWNKSYWAQFSCWVIGVINLQHHKVKTSFPKNEGLSLQLLIWTCSLGSELNKNIHIRVCFWHCAWMILSLFQGHHHFWQLHRDECLGSALLCWCCPCKKAPLSVVSTCSCCLSSPVQISVKGARAVPEGSRCPNGATKTRHRRYSFHCCLIQCVITRGAQRSFSTAPCEVLGSVWCNCCFSVEAGCCEGSQHYLLDVRIPGELGWSKGNHWTTEFGSIAGHCKTNLLHRT